MTESWYVGTGTLVGTIIGAIVGFIIQQPPVMVALGVAVGASLDTWLYNRNNR